MTKLQKRKKQIIKNRLWALLLMFLGYLTIFIDGDATAFIFFLIIGLIVFFNEEVIIH